MYLLASVPPCPSARATRRVSASLHSRGPVSLCHSVAPRSDRFSTARTTQAMPISTHTRHLHYNCCLDSRVGTVGVTKRRAFRNFCNLAPTLLKVSSFGPWPPCAAPGARRTVAGRWPCPSDSASLFLPDQETMSAAPSPSLIPPEPSTLVRADTVRCRGDAQGLSTGWMKTARWIRWLRHHRQT